MTMVPRYELPNGDDVPGLGFGTWTMDGEAVKTSVRTAPDASYTLSDTADGDTNEADIGEDLAGHERERDTPLYDRPERDWTGDTDGIPQ